MSDLIKTVVDHRRGCGWRKEGGIYMMSSGISSPCGKLPVPLTVCPCCSAGIKQARGWTWFNPQPFMAEKPCSTPKQCGGCVAAKPPPRAGLMWIGEKFYRTPAEWTSEALRLGVSRRVSMIPKDFKLGETWVFCAHSKAIQAPMEAGKELSFIPGIFHVFRPDRLEYVTRGNETKEELEALIKRGIQPVKVKRSEEQMEMEETKSQEGIDN